MRRVSLLLLLLIHHVVVQGGSVMVDAFLEARKKNRPCYSIRPSQSSSRRIRLSSHIIREKGIQDSSTSSVVLPSTKDHEAPRGPPRLIFPGYEYVLFIYAAVVYYVLYLFSPHRWHDDILRRGGIYFYWQAGVVSYLREQPEKYDLEACSMSGASAGALTATLAACQVDFEKATALALDLAAQAHMWDRGSWGLQGIWGPMIEEWLDRLLPSEEEDDLLLKKFVGNQRLRILVTPIPSFGKEGISEFESKQDLIRCNMASVHLPYFLNGDWVTDFRGRPMMDGSFQSQLADYLPPHEKAAESSSSNILMVDWKCDPVMQSQASGLSFIQTLSPDGIWSLLDQGRKHAQIMEEQGDFEILIPRRTTTTNPAK